MIDKRIEHYQREIARLFELLIREKLLQQQDVIIKAINEHEAVIRELKHIKKLNLGSVSAMLPSDDEIEANGIEGGLRDGELQLFWEGGTWLKNHLLKLLKPKGN